MTQDPIARAVEAIETGAGITLANAPDGYDAIVIAPAWRAAHGATARKIRRCWCMWPVTAQRAQAFERAIGIR